MLITLKLSEKHVLLRKKFISLTID